MQKMSSDEALQRRHKEDIQNVYKQTTEKEFETFIRLLKKYHQAEIVEDFEDDIDNITF